MADRQFRGAVRCARRKAQRRDRRHRRWARRRGRPCDRSSFAGGPRPQLDRTGADQNLPALLSKASLYIGNDTGTTHIAAKLGVPTICVFSGAADHRVWQPRGANVRTIRVAIGCSPCHLDRREECPVDVKCLRLIWVDDVLSTALAMLNELDLKRTKA